MDDHARRVVFPVLDCLERYEAEEASLTELQSAAGAAAGALDNAHADLRAALARLEVELEKIAFTVPTPEQMPAVSRAVVRVRQLASDS